MLPALLYQCASNLSSESIFRAGNAFTLLHSLRVNFETSWKTWPSYLSTMWVFALFADLKLAHSLHKFRQESHVIPVCFLLVICANLNSGGTVILNLLLTSPLSKHRLRFVTFYSFWSPYLDRQIWMAKLIWVVFLGYISTLSIENRWGNKNNFECQTSWRLHFSGQYFGFVSCSINEEKG